VSEPSEMKQKGRGERPYAPRATNSWLRHWIQTTDGPTDGRTTRGGNTVQCIGW